MKIKAFALIPATFECKEEKFGVETAEGVWSSGCEGELNIIKVNCPSLSAMSSTIDRYFSEVIKRKPTSQNVLMATYLGIMQVLLHESPTDNPIPDDIINILHQDEELRNVTSSSGHYFMVDAKEWDNIERTIKKTMGNLP